MTNWRDDYDFPMSWTFWRAICREHGFDPGDNEPIPEESTAIIEQPEWNRRQWDKVQQLKGQMNHLENEVIRLLKPKKQEGNPKKKPVKPYKGVDIEA